MLMTIMMMVVVVVVLTIVDINFHLLRYAGVAFTVLIKLLDLFQQTYQPKAIL